MANETSDPKYKIVDQGANVTANSENKRIATVVESENTNKAKVPTEDSENKRATK